jgi:hypothetical protein
MRNPRFGRTSDAFAVADRCDGRRARARERSLSQPTHASRHLGTLALCQPMRLNPAGTKIVQQQSALQALVVQEEEWGLAAESADMSESAALSEEHSAAHADADECAGIARSTSDDESPLNAVWDEMRLGPSPLDAAHDRVYYPHAEPRAERIDAALHTWDALGAAPRQPSANTNPSLPISVADAHLMDNVQAGAEPSPFQPRAYASCCMQHLYAS